VLFLPKNARILRGKTSWQSAVLDRFHGRKCPQDVRRTSNTGKTTASIGTQAHKKAVMPQRGLSYGPPLLCHQTLVTP
jgi:hypothetical protein